MSAHHIDDGRSAYGVMILILRDATIVRKADVARRR
jgi:hypothetical protein